VAAEEQLRIALEIQKEALGPEHPELAMTLHNLADTILPSERFPEAGPQHPFVADTLVVLGSLYAARNEYALAESTLDRALAIWAVAPTNDPLPEGEALANLALVKQAQGRFLEAVPLYERAISRFETGAGSRSPSALRARYNEAAAYASMGNYSVAIRRYEEMLASERAAYGDDDPALARPLIGLATVNLEMGLYGKAQPLYEQAIALLEVTEPLEVRGLAFATGGLADCYVSQQRFSEAEPLYRRGIALLESREKSNLRELGAMNGNLASVLSAQGRHAEARPLYARSIEILTKAYGSTHPVVGRLYHEQARTDRALNQLSLAQVGYEKALAIREQDRARDPVALGETLHHLGQVYAAQRKQAEAARALQRAMQVLEAQLGSSDSMVVSVRQDYEKLNGHRQ
jgi:tetratricopeptide (TPR) repeat protein